MYSNGNQSVFELKRLEECFSQGGKIRQNGLKLPERCYDKGNPARWTTAYEYLDIPCTFRFI